MIHLDARDDEGAMVDRVLTAAEEVRTLLRTDVPESYGNCNPQMQCLGTAGVHSTYSVWAVKFCKCKGAADAALERVDSETDLTLLAIQQVYDVVVYVGVDRKVLVEDRTDYHSGMIALYGEDHASKG